MRKLSLILIILPSITFANDWENNSNLFNAQDLYISGGLSYSLNNVQTNINASKKNSIAKKTMDFTIAIGKNINNDFRADVNLTYMPSSDFKMKSVAGKVKQEISSTMILANAAYDFAEIKSNVKIYGTLGGGFAVNKSNNFTYKPNNGAEENKYFSKTKYNLAWQIGFGVTGEITPRMNWDFGYKYINKGVISSANPVINTILPGYKAKLNNHAFTGSLRYSL